MERLARGSKSGIIWPSGVIVSFVPSFLRWLQMICLGVEVVFMPATGLANQQTANRKATMHDPCGSYEH